MLQINVQPARGFLLTITLQHRHIDSKGRQYLGHQRTTFGKMKAGMMLSVR